MSFKNIVRELKDMKHWLGRSSSHIAPDLIALPEPIEQGQWANLPPELLFDIIQRVENSNTSWPATKVLVSCASVCRSWRNITKEIVKTLEECGRITFPISLKQPGPRDVPIQCFIKRDRTTSTYHLYLGLTPSEDENDKLLMAAKKIKKATRTDFAMSLISDNFSKASNTYVGKLRSNFMGTKFTIHDTQPQNSRSSNNNTKQASPRLHAHNNNVATISYELNVLRRRGPRRMNCVMLSIPVSSIEEGGQAPTPTNEKSISPPILKEKMLVLKNKAPRWHEHLQCWCLNFKGRVTVASVKNFQLMADVDPSLNLAAGEQDKVILQFGKIGKDIFTLDYRYPLSAFQAFAICLSCFDTKPACE